MSIAGRTSHLCYDAHTLPRITTQRVRRFLQATASGEFHAEVRKAFAFAIRLLVMATSVQEAVYAKPAPEPCCCIAIRTFRRLLNHSREGIGQTAESFHCVLLCVYTRTTLTALPCELLVRYYHRNLD